MHFGEEAYRDSAPPPLHHVKPPLPPHTNPLPPSHRRCLRLFELTPGDDFDEDEDDSAGNGPSLGLVGQVPTHSDRATGVAATRRRAVTVGEDGVASVVDLQRLADDGGGGGGGGAGAGAGAGLVWTGRTKGAMPLSGVTFQGESEEVWYGSCVVCLS